MTIAEQIVQQTAGGRLRTLIIGAGVAGLTLAALLQQRGELPAIVERSADFGEGGYNIGLYPLGSNVLHGLGLFDRYLDVSAPIRFYQMGNGHGEIMHDFDLGPTMDRFGAFRGLRRRELLELLWQPDAGAPIHFGTRAAAIENRDGKVIVTFSDGSQGEFDLVVGADGMHSETRKQILDANEFAYHETEWACWVAWAPLDIIRPETATEFWGAGRFIGIYPVKDQQGVVLAGPKGEMQKEGRVAFAERVQEQFGMMSGPIPAMLQAVEAEPDAFFWDLHDCRCESWVKGRVVLLGDAACGFLPTAGVGASMAMLSAAALADELSRTDSAHIEYALSLYERRNKKRMEAAQGNSRMLGRLAFVKSAPLAWGREQFLRLYTLDQALKDIIKIMDGGI